MNLCMKANVTYDFKFLETGSYVAQADLELIAEEGLELLLLLPPAP